MKRILLIPVILAAMLLSACGSPTTTEQPTVTMYTLTTSISPSGAGSVSPSTGQYEEGSQVTLTATPANGYTFYSWSGDALGSLPTIAVTIDSNKSLAAHFKVVESELEGETEELAPIELTPEPAVASFGPGTHLVGNDIEPGRYRSEGVVTYFERLSGLSGELGDIIANDALSQGPVIVDIKDSDVAFKSSGSVVWYLIDESYHPELKTSFGDGLWIVGVEITPGTYRTQDDVTYWARLSDFSHELSGILANEAVVAGGDIVEIKASDVGFETQGGAIWTRIN